MKGESLAQKIGAHRYFEVCVETHEGLKLFSSNYSISIINYLFYNRVWEVFDISVHEVLKSVANPSKELGLVLFTTYRL